MPRQPKFRPPPVSSPPTPYEVFWLDAAHDNDHDGPAAEAGGLALLPFLGYHVRTFTDRTRGNRRCIVLASEHSIDDRGRPCSRFEMTIPVAWVASMTPLRKEPDSAENLRNPDLGALGT